MVKHEANKHRDEAFNWAMNQRSSSSMANSHYRLGFLLATL